MFTYARAFCRLALMLTLVAGAVELYPIWLSFRYFRYEETFARSQSLAPSIVAILLELTAIVLGVAVYEAQKVRASHHFRPYALGVILFAFTMLPSSGVIVWLAIHAGV
jgi:hypothetical protein